MWGQFTGHMETALDLVCVGEKGGLTKTISVTATEWIAQQLQMLIYLFYPHSWVLIFFPSPVVRGTGGIITVNRNI